MKRVLAAMAAAVFLGHMAASTGPVAADFAQENSARLMEATVSTLETARNSIQTLDRYRALLQQRRDRLETTLSAVRRDKSSLSAEADEISSDAAIFNDDAMAYNDASAIHSRDCGVVSATGQGGGLGASAVSSGECDANWLALGLQKMDLGSRRDALAERSRRNGEAMTAVEDRERDLERELRETNNELAAVNDGRDRVRTQLQALIDNMDRGSLVAGN